MLFCKTLLSFLLLVVLTVEIEGSGAGAAIAGGAAMSLSGIFQSLDSLSQSHYDNFPVVQCFWNDWQSRDTFARTQCTYTNGRFSHPRRFWGIPNGRWYCAYYQIHLYGLGWSLDRSGCPRIDRNN